MTGEAPRQRSASIFRLAVWAVIASPGSPILRQSAPAFWVAPERAPNVLRPHSAPKRLGHPITHWSKLLIRLERATGIEPATRSLGSYCSTTELHPRRPSHNTALRRPKAVESLRAAREKNFSADLSY